jgi:hypothetical protein
MIITGGLKLHLIVKQMRVIITESQYYNLIPNEIKRRMTPEDFEILDNIVKAKYRGRAYWTYADNFGKYFNNVISDSLDQFVFNFKVEDDENWFKKRHVLRRIFNSLVRYLKVRYSLEARAYYKRMRS